MYSTLPPGKEAPRVDYHSSGDVDNHHMYLTSGSLGDHVSPDMLGSRYIQ